MGLFLSEKINIDEYTAIDFEAKKVLETLSEFNHGEYASGEQLQHKTGLTPEVINSSVKVLEKSLMVNNPSISREKPPYEFEAVEITDFGRQVLEKYG